MTGLLKAVEIRSDIQTSASFHRRVVGAVRAEATVSRWRRPFALIRESLTNWRVALALAGATAAIVAWSASWLNFGGAPDHTGSATFDPPAQAGLTLRMKGDVDPTAANYQRVASHSLEKLDELFASQGNRNPPSAPVFTAAMVARGSLPD